MNGANLVQNRVRKRRGLEPRNDVVTTSKAVTLRGSQRVMCVFPTVMHLSMFCRRGGGGAAERRQGMGWGFDGLCWSWGRAFDWSCSPRGGDIWIFLRPTWRYLTADSDEKGWDQRHVSDFHASRMHRTVWKDLEIMEANENKRKLGGFHCFVFKFRLF